jgi:hypothetical protein
MPINRQAAGRGRNIDAVYHGPEPARRNVIGGFR